MKLSKISPDDPMLTAYALGELDASEATEIAAAIERDSSAQHAVSEIRAAAEEFRTALQDEPIGGIVLTKVPALVAPKPLAPVVPFPYYMVGAAAVAGFACLFALRSPLVTSPATAGATRSSQVVSTPSAVRPLAAPADQVTSSNYLANVIPDGFSDLKPAPFRDAGYRLGKSIASSDSTAVPAKAADKISAASDGTASRESSEVATNDTAATQNSMAESTPIANLAEAKNELAASYELVPVSISDLPAVEGKGTDQSRHEQLTLKIRYQVPLIDVNRKGNIIGSGNSFAMAATHLKFSLGVTGFGSMLKETPRATTYEEVLSWSAESDKSGAGNKRDDFIELVKKPKNATVE